MNQILCNLVMYHDNLYNLKFKFNNTVSELLSFFCYYIIIILK